MAGKKDSNRLPSEPEILRGHTVSDGEAALRSSRGVLKGASPVATADQTMFQVKELLLSSLPDGEGALRQAILARLESNPSLVARHFGEHRTLLRSFLERTLAGGEALADLVRDADARWGRMYDEKPRFERAGDAPAPDDPYTREGVRRALEHLLRHLSPGD